MKAQIKVLFYLRRSKVNPQGLMPIYQKIIIDKKPFDISTGKYVEEFKWSAETYRIKGNSEEARTINNHLEKLNSKVFETEKQLFLHNIELNFRNFKNEHTGKQERSRMLIPIFEEHNRKMKELIGLEYAPGTYERYVTSLKHTKDFLLWKYKLSDINIEKIDHAFITDYDFYLRTERKCANNTVIKYVKNFHKIINQCLANGWIGKDPFVNYKVKLREVVREFLTDSEIETIINKDLHFERLGVVRDIFIFSCFTGLAYIDVKQLSRDNISIGIDGEKWIFKNRQKTETISKIPLLPMAMEILKKYENYPLCLNRNSLLPIMSNQRMNSYLKEIATLCKINKDLTFHIARHTFATTVTLTNGVPLETVSKMLGHTSIKTTQHYAKIVDKKISNDMMLLRAKLDNKNLEKRKCK